MHLSSSHHHYSDGLAAIDSENKFEKCKFVLWIVRLLSLTDLAPFLKTVNFEARFRHLELVSCQDFFLVTLLTH